MHKIHALSPLLLLLAACSTDSTPPVTAPATLAYPAAARGAQVDDYHGTRVEDPYRWLERVDDTQTHQWVTAENALAQPYLEGIAARETIKKRLTQLWNFERYDIPVKRGGPLLLFAQRRPAEPERAVRRRQFAGAAARAARSERLSKDATVALGEIVPSRDGKLLAYSLSDGGTDWRTWRLPRGGDRPRSARRAAVHEICGCRVDAGRARLLLRALSVTRRRLRRRLEATRGLLAQAGHAAGSGRARVQGRRTIRRAIRMRRGFRRRPLPGHLGLRRLAADRHLLPHAGAGRLALSEVVRLFDTFDAEYAFLGETTTRSMSAPPRTRRSQ